LPPGDAGAVSGFSRDLRPTEKRRWTGCRFRVALPQYIRCRSRIKCFLHASTADVCFFIAGEAASSWTVLPGDRQNPRPSRREPRQLLAMTTMDKRNDPVADFSAALRPHQVDDRSRAWHHCFPTQSRPRFARSRELQFHEFGSGSGENRSDPDPVGCLASPRMSLMPEHRQSTRDCILDARAPPTGKDARQAIRHRSNRSFSHHQEAS